MKKHDKQLGVLEQNLSAQENIFRAVTEANAKYAQTRKSMLESKRQRSDTVNALTAAFDIFVDVQSKAGKGTDFYSKLSGVVENLVDRTNRLQKSALEQIESMRL